MVASHEGYRNGYGKPRRLSMMAGTITVWRPRVRGMEERFESRLLRLFVRRTEQVAELLPELYLHGLAEGDFELALRGLLGEGAPLSASSIERLRDEFVGRYGKGYPKAAETLCQDWERMVASERRRRCSDYQLPKKHWRHLRTTNVVESPFAALRPRTSPAKRFKKVANAEALIWKMLMVAEKRFRRLNAPELLGQVVDGKKFVAGIAVRKGNGRIAA